LIKLDASVLYGPLKVKEQVDPAIKGSKAALENHHLFPRGYLQEQGITDLKKINQIANFAPVEWPTNIKIGKQAPSVYVPEIDAKLSAKDREEMYSLHALPHLWWELPYEEFLIQRRSKMADVIHTAWRKLRGDLPESTPTTVDIASLIESGESDGVEFKSTLRTNLHTGKVDEKMHLSALKTIAGFLNAKGGTLLIGVQDDGEVIGIDADGFPNEDKMGLHLINLIRDRIGEVFLPYVHAHFEEKDGQKIMAIRCEKGPKAAYLKDGPLQRFFVRGGNATAELSGPSITEYVVKRFD
jgi:hypothetical protein